MRKLIYFLLFILILPAVNAFLDLRGIYDSNPFVFDFLVFFAIFGLIARISFGRLFGKTETTQRLLSAVVAFALAFAGVYAGLSLSVLGDIFSNSPIIWFLIAIASFLGLFVFLSWIFKVAGIGKPWLAFLITTIISLCLYYFIFPENILMMIPLDFDFMGNVVSSLFVLFLILVLASLIFFGIRLLKKGSSGSSELSSKPSKGPNSKTPKVRKLKAFVVKRGNIFAIKNIQVELGKEILFDGKVKGGSGKYTYNWKLVGRKSLNNAPRTFSYTFLSEGKYRLMFGVKDSDGNVGVSKVYIINVKTPVHYIKRILQQQKVSKRKPGSSLLAKANEKNKERIKDEKVKAKILAKIERRWPGKTPKKGTTEYYKYIKLYDEAKRIRKRLSKT